MSPLSKDEELIATAVAVRAGLSLPQDTLVRQLSRVGAGGALAVSATGLVVLLGWTFDVDRLTRLSPMAPSLTPEPSRLASLPSQESPAGSAELRG